MGAQVWKPYCCGPVVLNFLRYQNNLEGLLKNTDCWDPPPEFLILWVWVRAWEFAFLTSFHMMWCCWSWDHHLRITALAKRTNQLLNRHQILSSHSGCILFSLLRSHLTLCLLAHAFSFSRNQHECHNLHEVCSDSFPLSFLCHTLLPWFLW